MSLPTVRPMQPAEACVRLYANALNALSHSDYFRSSPSDRRASTLFRGEGG